jgi:hypothetical protein
MCGAAQIVFGLIAVRNITRVQQVGAAWITPPS